LLLGESESKAAWPCLVLTWVKVAPGSSLATIPVPGLVARPATDAAMDDAQDELNEGRLFARG